jgi:hypothetical protein
MLSYSGRFKLAHPDVTCENFDGEYVILNLASGHYFALSRSASAVLAGILEGFDVQAISEIVGDAASDEVYKFLTEMIRYNLIAPDAVAVPTPLTAEWTDAARMANDPLQLEAYDDIADLIAADPIHESDETAGWPIAKQ